MTGTISFILSYLKRMNLKKRRKVSALLKREPIQVNLDDLGLIPKLDQLSLLTSCGESQIVHIYSHVPRPSVQGIELKNKVSWA